MAVDIQELDRRAVAVCTGIVDQVRAGQLDQPTPCADWRLRDLLGHMVGQNYGFAAAAEGESTDASVWADRPVGDDPAGVFAASAARVVAAFNAQGAFDRRLWIPAISTAMFWPAPQAFGFHFIDYVVHAWDVAVSIGVPVEFDQEVLDEAMVRAQEVPLGPSREAAGAAFRAPVSAPDGAGLLDRIVALLGRSPTWPML